MLRNGFYNLAGQIVRGTTTLLTIPFLIHFLGLREYGVWSLAYAVLGLMLLGEMGISVAATVFLSKDLVEHSRDEASYTLTFVLTSGVLVAICCGLLFWFVGPLFGRFLPAFSPADRAEVGDALQIAGLAVTCFIASRVLVGVEQAWDRYGAINAIDVVQCLLTNLGFIAVAWQGGKSIALMKWQAFIWLLLLIAHCCFALKLLGGKGFSPSWSVAKVKRMIKFTTATWTSMLGSVGFGVCDRLIVGGLLGAPVLGAYSAITNITARINTFSGIAVQPLVPSISRDTAMQLSVENRVREAVHLNGFLVGGAGIFLCVLADQVLSLMVPGTKIPQDILGLQIAALIYALYSFNAPGYYILFSIGHEWQNAIISLLSAVATLSLIFFGARHFGLLGALAGNIGYFGTLLMIGIGIKKLGIPLRTYTSWVAVPLVGLCGGFVVGASIQGHLAWRIVFVAVQGLLLLFWFSREENGIARLKLACGLLWQG